MTYRTDIQVLRAFAVVSVIFYHMDFIVLDFKLFQGGYVGVDIFFVISGYLISKIILSEILETNEFRFRRFYERRARRILPLLLLVIFVSLPFAWALLLPNALEEYAQAIFSSLFFYSNFFFHTESVQYGGESSLLKPFLHTWSLSIEEQFYIVFPVLTLLYIRFLRRSLPNALPLLLLACLIASELTLRTNAQLSFYFTLTRAWELLAGTYVAVHEGKFKKLVSFKYKNVYYVSGAFLLFSSPFIFSAETPHPGLNTLWPVLGTCLVLIFKYPNSFIERMLNWRFAAWVGTISYSLYLWHYPVFSFLT